MTVRHSWLRVPATNETRTSSDVRVFVLAEPICEGDLPLGRGRHGHSSPLTARLHSSVARLAGASSSRLTPVTVRHALEVPPLKKTRPSGMQTGSEGRRGC